MSSPEHSIQKRIRLVHYPDDCHAKNKESIQRMCAAKGLDYEATNDRARLMREDYDIAFLPMRWISPDDLPKSIKILYGPHFSVFPEGPLIGPLHPEWSKRCAYNVLTDWNEVVFREFAPETIIPLVKLPFGINPAIEDVKHYPKTLECLIYTKRRNAVFLKFVEERLKHMGLSYKVFSYGSYRNAEYMATLKQVKFVIWIGTHESQGFAFQECLASNVPILLWDVTTMMDEFGSYTEYKNKKNLYATTATKWSSMCGERIIREYEFESALHTIQNNISRYSPREFILSEVSDTKTMEKMLDYFR
jgi:hypothetical protein